MRTIWKYPIHPGPMELGTFLLEMGALVFHLYETSTVKTVVE